MIENFETVLLIVLVCVALALIGLVLIQQGKGADAGASFGGGGAFCSELSCICMLTQLGFLFFLILSFFSAV